MKKVVSIFGVLFILAKICTMALADAVPGALLYLDAVTIPRMMVPGRTSVLLVENYQARANRRYSKRAQSRYLLLVLIQSRSSIPTRSPVSAGAAKVTTSNCFLSTGPSSFYSKSMAILTRIHLEISLWVFSPRSCEEKMRFGLIFSRISVSFGANSAMCRRRSDLIRGLKKACGPG